MSPYRKQLPQLSGRLFLADTGLETMLIYQQGFTLAAQIATFAGTDADMVSAFMLTYPDEAIGIVDAAAACEMPVAISFTLETDGRLPSGDALCEAIDRTDTETGSYAAYYVINCVHPTHAEPALAEPGPWRERLHGVRANASRRSHAELDEATELDAGDPKALGEHYLALHRLLPRMNVVGGCCGTDERHVDSIARHLTGTARGVGWAPLK